MAKTCQPDRLLQSTLSFIFLAAALVLQTVMIPFSGLASAADTVDILGTITLYDKDGKPKDNLEGVVVFVDAMENPGKAVVPQNSPEMIITREKFFPIVLPVVVGSTVSFPNNDAVPHDIFLVSANKNYDLGLYGPGDRKSVVLDQTGLVNAYCNTSPKFYGYILVLANNYFTTTDFAGIFEIRNVPYGKAVIRTWHAEGRVYPEMEVIIDADGVKDAVTGNVLDTISFNVVETPVSTEHNNKFNQPYSTPPI